MVRTNKKPRIKNQLTMVPCQNENPPRETLKVLASKNTHHANLSLILFQIPSIQQYSWYLTR